MNIYDSRDGKWKSFWIVLLVYVFLGLFFVMPAEALRLKTNWAKRADLSEKVVRGQAIDVRSYWNPERTLIYTDVRVLIDEHIKGNGSREITLTIPGGTVGNDTHWVSDTPQFNVRDYGVILLEPSGQVTGGPDGVYLIPEPTARMNQLQAMPEDRFLSWIKAYVSGQTEVSFEDIPKATSGGSMDQETLYATISGVSPATISAGTGDLVTVSGSGFGGSRGSGEFPTIAFRYKDDNYMFDNSSIRSWSDAQIQVEVWTGVVNNYPHSPGSWGNPYGTVAFINSSGSFESFYPLTITFGYGWVKWATSTVSYYVNATDGPSGALSAIQNASNAWTGAEANFSFNYAGSTASGWGQDGYNIISFANLGSSIIIAQARTYFSNGIISEADIQFNTGFPWSTDPTPPSDKMDLQSTAVHELGHWLRLLDLYGENDTAKVMYGFGALGEVRRNLDSTDQAGIQWIYLCPVPGIPSLISPSDGTTGVSTAPLLDWSDLSDITSYDVQVCSDSTCSSVVDTANLTISQWKVEDPLNSLTTYYWRVRANNACGSGSWSGIWSFTTCQALSPPTLVSPSNGTTVNTLTPKLDWSTVMGATNFDVQVCSDINCSSVVRSHNTGTNLSEWTVLPALDPVKTYYWRVRVNNPCGPSPWTTSRSFTTYCPTPGTPLNNVPPTGATGVSTNPTLSWLASSNADFYEVYCDTSPTPQTLVGTTNSTSYPLSGLSCNVKYYWKIVAKNTCGNSKTGSVSQFTTGPTPGAPLNPSPPNGATEVATSLTLSWSASSDADSYDVYFGTSSNPPNVGNTTDPNYPVSGLSTNTTYYWKIVAKSNCGKSTSGAVWNFKTYFPGVLEVTPSDGLSSSGPQGGPFSPASKSYTLKNTGGFSINWSASLAGNSNWITLSSTSGSLAPNATAPVTVSINSNANTLASGANYSDTLNFTNTTNGDGSTFRVVDVTVYSPGVLEVTPSDDLSSSGPQGGPFSPSSNTYTLKNTGGFSIDWTASLAGSSNWITLSSTSGALSPNATTPVTVSINSNANSLAPNFNYSDTVSFRNTTNGNGNTSRGIDLTVLCPTPGTPSSPSPSDGATSVTIHPTLSWASSAKTDSYDVYLGTSADPPYVTNTTNNTYSPPTLNPTTLYYWKIVAKNTCGNSTSGPIWSFTTAVLPPSPPTLASPTNNATRVSLTPTLGWNASSGASSYRLQVSTNNTFLTTVFDQDGISGTSQAVTGLLNNTTYYWRVNATNAGGTGDWSTTWSFTTIVTSVVVSGRQLLVNGNPFMVKGVGYSPVPICDDPETVSPYGDYFTSAYSAIYDRDLPLLREMGANTIRLWGWNNTADHLDFLDKAYNGGVNPIYVIAGFWINPGLNINPFNEINVREEIKDNFRQMVATHKNHPAILMWAIGNELNAPDMYGGKLNHLFSLINEMSEVAHAEEGAAYHPVTTPLMDVDLISTLVTYESSVPKLDIWGVNAYRGNTFGTLFNDYKPVSSKPLVILEYGIDAYDQVNQKEYQDVQADYAEDLWNEIKANSDVCIGGSLMEYSDEWWKGKHSTDPGCPDNDACYHGTCGYAAPSHPDGYANEEWWGIMRTVDNGSAPDMMEPRDVYYRLQALWLSLSPTLEVTPSDGLTSSGPQGGPFSPNAKLYTIKNTGSGVLNWAITKAQSWVTLSGTGGTLGAGNSAMVTVEINSEANALAPDTYTDTLSFTNKTNGNGNTTRSVFLTVTPSALAPVVTSFKINNGASSTASRTVTLNNTATNAPTHYMAGESPTFDGATWQAYSTAPKFTLSTGSGTKTVYFKVKNNSGESARVSDSIVAPRPIVTSFKINNGALNTVNATVTLNNTATNSPTHCKAASTLTALEYADWQTYSVAPKFTLGSGIGTKVVYFKVKNDFAESEDMDDTIEALAPTVTSLKINSGVPSTTNETVTLNNVATGSPTNYIASEDMGFAGAIWKGYSTAPSFALSSGSGTKKVYFKVKNDFAESDYAVDIIEALAPVVASFRINAGATTTTKGAVTLNNTATNSPTHYMASEDPDFPSGVWQAYSTTPKFTLSSGSGTKTVYVKVKNDFDQSVAVSDTISALAPAVTSLKINNGALSMPVAIVTLNNTAVNTPTHYMASESSIFSGAIWQAYSIAPSFALSSGSGTKTVYFKVKNDFDQSVAASDTISALAPVVTSLKINNGEPSTTNGVVTLNIMAMNTPTHYKASEDPNFGDASWQPYYSTAPKFTLSYGGGTKKVYFKVKNNFAESPAISDDIVALAPRVVSFRIDAGAVSTANSIVKLNYTAANSPTHYMASELPNFNGASWQPYSQAPNFTLSDGSGTKTIYFKVKNSVGESTPVSDTIDATGLPPAVTSFNINGGAPSTVNGIVTLNNMATRSPTHYRASEDPNFGDANWQTYTTAAKFTLSGGGTKTIYFKVKNIFGESPVKNDTILALAPAVTSLRINSGAATTANGVVTLNNAARYSPTHYMASEDINFNGTSWQTYSIAPKFSLSEGSGTKTIYFKLKNSVGESPSASDTIDATGLPPAVTSFNINAGAASTGNNTVTLNNTVTNSPTHYMASESDTFAGADWQIYSLSAKFTLSEGAGTKTLYFKVKNIYGESAPKTDIILALVPTVSSFRINAGAASTANSIVTLNNIANNSPTHYKASEDPNFVGADWQIYSTAPKFTLSEGSGTKTLYFKVKNGFVESGIVSDTILASGMPPVVTSFGINGRAPSTTKRAVTLNNAATPSPTHYMASEDPNFSGASWQAYGIAPNFVLSAESGPKTVYFKLKNGFGESSVVSDTIFLY